MPYFTAQKELLKLASKPLGQGGEGTVFEIVSPAQYQDKVVKIFHPKEQSPARAQKIKYMLQNTLPQLQNIAAWPQELVYHDSDGKNFAGYLMPKISEAIDLTHLCSLQLSHKLSEVWKEKFDRNTALGMQNRIRVCENLARAFAWVHQSQKYVFIDIKPENIKVNLAGEITLLDMDSVGILAQNELRWLGQKASPEYSPAELKNVNLSKDILSETWDRFSMAIVFYKILLGLHPFTGTCHSPFDKLDTYAQKIQEGLFPLGHKAALFRIVPLPHKGFYYLADALQKLFRQCFDEGHLAPNARPHALTWLNVFEAIQQPAPLPVLSKRRDRKKSHTQALNTLRHKSTVPALLRTALGGIALVATALTMSIHLSSYKVPNQKIEIVQNSLMPKTLSPKELARKYGYVNRFHNGVAKVSKKGKYGFINQYGEVVIPFDYDWADGFQEGAARVSKGKKFGAIDKKGQTIIPIQYDWIGRFNEGLARVFLDDKVAYFNPKNQIVVDFHFDYGGDFEEGLAIVSKAGKWGFIDKKGQEVVPLQFEALLNFHEGLAAAKMNNRWGFINQQGAWEIPPQFNDVHSFVEGRAIVRLKNRNFEIDSSGKCVAFCPE